MFEISDSLAIEIKKALESVQSTEVKELGTVYKMIITNQGKDRDGEVVMID